MAILATGVDDLTIDDLTIDTTATASTSTPAATCASRTCSVNAPNDDAIVPQELVRARRAARTENVTITNSLVSGFDVGTMLDGTFGRTTVAAPDRDGPTGRIKLGTESNGAFATSRSPTSCSRVARARPRDGGRRDASRT